MLPVIRMRMAWRFLRASGRPYLRDCVSLASISETKSPTFFSESSSDVRNFTPKRCSAARMRVMWLWLSQSAMSSAVVFSWRTIGFGGEAGPFEF